jgi:hypothetical protein
MACFRMMVRTFKLLGVWDPSEMMNWKSCTDVLAAMLILCLQHLNIIIPTRKEELWETEMPRRSQLYHTRRLPNTTWLISRTCLDCCMGSRQRCHYTTRVGGPHAPCTFLILILHGPPSRYTSTYTCERQRTGHTTIRIFHHGVTLCITLENRSSFWTQALPFG